MTPWTPAPTQMNSSGLRENSPDVLLIIRRSGEKFAMSILAFGQQIPASINLYPDDIPPISTSLRDAFEQVLRTRPHSPGYTPEKSALAVRQLAKAGKDAFQKVFSDRNAARIIERLLDRYERIKFQIIADKGFSFPWEMLYVGDVMAEASFEYFWGMRHIITRNETDTSPEDIAPPIITFSSRPTVGLLTDANVPSIDGKEIPYFEGLEKIGRINLLHLRALDPSKEVEEFKELQGFWRQPLNLAQVACHAYYDRNNLNDSFLSLSNDFKIKLRDMSLYNVVIKNRPLLILNACSTGKLSPLSTASFVNMFVDQGALGVIATECLLPHAFAAAFAEQFYDLLLQGADNGGCLVEECLLAARRYFLEQHNDPTGLLYSMYAPLSTRLERHTQGD